MATWLLAECQHCGEQIERAEQQTTSSPGWVETRSGDAGGNYDLCPANQPALVHQAKPGTVRHG